MTGAYGSYRTWEFARVDGETRQLREAYRAARTSPDASGPDGASEASRKRLEIVPDDAREGRAELRIFTTSATWCEACKKGRAQFERLRAAFGREEVARFGVPVDETEGPELLRDFVRRHEPACRHLVDIPRDRAAALARHAEEDLVLDGVPTTTATDREGRVLETLWAAPTVSQLRRLLDEANDRSPTR